MNIKKVCITALLALGLAPKAFALDPVTIAYLVQGLGFALMQVQENKDPKVKSIMQQNMQLNMHLDHSLGQAYPDTSKEQREGFKLVLWSKALEQNKEGQEAFVRDYIKYLINVGEERERLKKMSSLNKFQVAVESGRVCANLPKDQAQEFLKVIGTAWNPWPREVSDVWQQQCQKMLVTLSDPALKKDSETDSKVVPKMEQTATE